MEDIVLRIGDILEDYKNTERQYRIINIREGLAVLCEMNNVKLILFYVSCKDITENVILKNIKIITEQKAVYDLGLFDEKELRDFEKRRSLIREVVEYYGPTYMDLMGHSKKEEIILLTDKYQISRYTFWVYVRKFLQSGCDEYALVDKRHQGCSKHRNKPYNYTMKTGRKYKTGLPAGVLLTDEIRLQLQYGLEIYKSGRAMSIQTAYDMMNDKYFSHIEEFDGGQVSRLIPKTKRPTYDQLYYFITNRLSEEEKDAIKTSKQEQRNNKRLSLSDSLKDVYGPGDLVEMDEAEVDVSLVSASNTEQAVSRPIFYVMKDVYTRLIIAVSVSFNNNSVEGMTNCFINLGEDKVEYCKRFGFNISENMWPSNFLPKRIRCDRGSEYRSDEARRIFNELNISRELVPGGTGSLKGLVEQVFHQINCAQNPLLENKGLIEKRHDSNHHREAMLDVFDYTKIVINYVLHYNQSHIDYPLTKEMLDLHVKPIPLNLWEYGCNKYGRPRPISNKEQYAYSLMTPVKNATLSKKGIKAHDRLYINRNDSELLSRMYQLQNKSEDFKCRIDVRQIRNIYYLRNNQLLVAQLNPDITGNIDFADSTLTEWMSYQKEIDVIKQEGKELNDQLRLDRLVTNKRIIAEAQKDLYSSTKNIKEEREKEKQEIQKENTIDKRLLGGEKMLSNVENDKTVDEQNIEVDSNDFTDIDFDVLDFKSAMEEFKERN